MGNFLGEDDESPLKQTLGDTGGMAGSASLGMLAGAGQVTPDGQPKKTSTSTKTRATTAPAVPGPGGRFPAPPRGIAR